MADKPLVVVTNRCFPETLAALAPFAEVEANPGPEPWTNGEVIRRCGPASAVMAFMTDRIDAAFIEACPRLRVIGAALKGYDNIDVAAAERAGVWVTIVPDLLTVPTAELAIGLTLSLSRHLVRADRLIRERGFHGWRPNLYGRGLDGARVGIVGFGRVGQAIAERLLGFGCRLAANDERAGVPPELARVVTQVGLADLLSTSDIIVLALPLTAGTLHIIDAAAISRMKPGALLVNPARGSLVDEKAVADALAGGKLGGYAADVFECEDWARQDRPQGIDPRLTAPGAPTVLTPHLGSAVEPVRREIERSAARSIVEALSGAVPVEAVNRPPRPRR